MIDFSYGQRRLLDSYQNLMASGPPVFLRLRNFTIPIPSAAVELGFALSPTGTADVGTTDICIEPAPSVNWVSVHNIGQSAGKLRFGARTFLVSHTFVLAQCSSMGIADPSTLWRSPFVVGLVTENSLYSVESVTSEQLSGQTVSWLLVCNGNELK